MVLVGLDGMYFFLLSYFLVVISSGGMFFIREGRARDQLKITYVDTFDLRVPSGYDGQEKLSFICSVGGSMLDSKNR